MWCGRCAFLHALGVETLIVTNASGGINLDFHAGDFMLIEDHINLTGQNPLIGPKEEGCVRFPDMSFAYDREYLAIFKRIAEKYPAMVHSGVYIGVTGPNYETPAEIRAFRTMGADAVGMSTVPEVLVARQLGLRVCGDLADQQHGGWCARSKAYGRRSVRSGTTGAAGVLGDGR